MRIKTKGRSHSGAKKTVVDGITFASIFEAETYKDLKTLEQIRVIFKLECHKSFPLERGDVVVRELRGKKVRSYTCDYTYLERGSGDSYVRVVVDAKGRITGEASLRMSVFKALYPEFDFRIIKQGKRRSSKRRKRLTK
jgi:hypothetical protein